MDTALKFALPRADDILTAAKTVWAEARGESVAGQIAVAFTIIRRAQIAAAWVAQHGAPHPHYGDGSLAGVCLVRAQYTCWNFDDPNYAKMALLTLDDADFQVAVYVVTGAVQRLLSNAMPAATHYYNPAKVARTPTWVTGVPAHDGQPAIPPAHFDGSIGHHRFYSQVAA